MAADHPRMAGPAGASRSHCPTLRTADVVPTERSSLRRVSARILGKFHCPSWRKGLGSAQRTWVRTVPTFSRAAPPVRRSRVPSPGRPVCTRRRARPPESPLDARRSGAERCTVVLVALCLCAVARVHVAVATSTHLAVETITNVYTRSQYVIYWLSQLELPPLEITWARL